MLRVGIAIAGDLLRESVRDCLVDNLAIETCAVYSVRQAMSLLQERQLDVLILDDQFDHSTWIGHLVSTFKEVTADIAIIIVGSFADGSLIYELFEAGADGYLYRGDDLRPLFNTSVETVSVHKPYLSPTATSEYAQVVHSQRTRQTWTLDAKSRQVLRMLAAGKHIQEIATELNLKDRQVYWIRTKLRRRFQATTNEEIIVHAGLQGYLKAERALTR